MALNKSSRSTPSSRSGYFTELTASTGKQTSFLLPVRIKVTPNNSLGPLSDKKKNPAKMLQPVLLKDLFQSTQKDRQNSSITSVSTQKKKNRPQRLTQPYLNTQSCYKPKVNEAEESSFFNRKSVGGNKVRRQLYQTLDSPQKSAIENKENINKNVKSKMKIKDSDEKMTKSTQIQNKNRKSLLLPPNSIKNNFIKTSAPNPRPSGKQSIRTSTATVRDSNRYTKNISRVTEVEKSKNKMRKTIHTGDKGDMKVDSSPDTIGSDKILIPNTFRDISTMTTPSINKKVLSSKSLSNLNTLERPSVIMGPSKVKSASEDLNDTEPPYLEMQNLNINTPYDYKVFSETSLNTGLNVNNSNADELMKLKFFLEQSIQACEDQAFKLKQALSVVNCILSDTSKADSQYSENIKNEDKCDKFNLYLNSEENSDNTDIVNKSTSEKNDRIVADKLPIPLKILVTDADLNQEAQEVSSEILNEMARLSTIGEVSCEVDDSNKDEKNDSENKENINNSIMNIVTPTPLKTPKTPRRRSIAFDSCESQPRRRSARLAAKRTPLSMSESDKQDSFTLLENELNVVHDLLPSKSLPASPMKPPMTPGVIRQWDKKLERPLKEYMTLKIDGNFLVTPDIKRFQSCLEPTDTPHSRKSLSRKIFMELCDLYAESPETK